MTAHLTGAPHVWDMAQEALTIARSVDDKAWQSMALTYLATSHDPRNTPDMRNAYSQEFLRLVEELHSPITNSMTTITLAMYARFEGDLPRLRLVPQSKTLVLSSPLTAF
jgi:hypothetical protein